jgi:hypothetical protein
MLKSRLQKLNGVTHAELKQNITNQYNKKYSKGKIQKYH